MAVVRSAGRLVGLDRRGAWPPGTATGFWPTSKDPLAFSEGLGPELVAPSTWYGPNASYATLYRTQPAIRTVVDACARNIAQLGLHTYERVSDTDRRRDTTSALAQLVTYPNPATTQYRLIEHTLIDFFVYGNAYLVKLRMGEDDPPFELWRAPAERVTCVGTLYPEAYWVYTVEGRWYEIPPRDVIHLREAHPGVDTVHGLSKIETLRRKLLEEIFAQGYRTQYWRQGARLSGVIHRPLEAPEWDKTTREYFRQEFNEVYGGSRGSGLVPVLDEGMTFTSVSHSAEEQQLAEARELHDEEVARAYHMPLPVVGLLRRATFCLPGDAQVYTEEGPRAIKEVRAGDAVWSLTPAGAWSLQTVARSACTGYDEILTIRTINRTLRLNAKHRVLARRAVEMPAPIAVMSDGHRRAVGRATKVWSSVYVPASALKVGDTVVSLRHLPADGTTVAPSGRQLTDAFMEVCGLLLGDGNISRVHGALVGLQFARAEGAPYMEAYREAIRSSFVRADGRAPHLIEGHRQTRLRSASVAAEMALLGFSGTAHTKTVPGWVFQTTEPLRLAFVRGFLDADGSVDKLGRISFSSCNERLLSQVRHLCLGVGVPVTNLRCQRGETRLPNGRRIAFAQWSFTCSDPGENQRIGSHTPTYVTRMANGKPFGRKAARYPWFGGRDFEEGATQLSKIRAITTSVIAEPVYDLEVEETHSFVADGVVVHNSNVKEQHKMLYQDALGPSIQMVEQELETRLVPEFAERGTHYLEFNVREKLRGSFEEQVASISTAVGRPWMTVNEARAIQNMPRDSDPASDHIAAPLNMTTGETTLETTLDADAVADEASV